MVKTFREYTMLDVGETVYINDKKYEIIEVEGKAQLKTMG